MIGSLELTRNKGTHSFEMLATYLQQLEGLLVALRIASAPHPASVSALGNPSTYTKQVTV